jgi:TrmH family RNA methyltransferase
VKIPGITSIKDPRIVAARALASKVGRQEKRKCLLNGETVIRWALSSPVAVEYVLLHDQLPSCSFLEELLANQIACYRVSGGILKKVTRTRYLVPWVGVADVAAVFSPRSARATFVMVLDQVQDYGNIGTIVRTALSFGIRDVIATQPDYDVFYRKTIDASRGHVFDIHLQRFASSDKALAQLKVEGYQVVATSSYGTQLQSLTPLAEKPLALVVGNESRGVSPEILEQADIVVQIPMLGQVESLNVGVATGISLYELKYRLVIAMLKHYIRATLGREVNVAGKLIQKALNVALSQISPFNSSQVILLMVLKCDGVMTLEQASRDIAIFEEDLTQLLGPLFESGYIEYAEKRSNIRLTTLGEQLLGQLWGIVESSEQQILEGFSEEERQRLFDYLQRIQRNCGRLIELEHG